jgi:hypothetical protein
LHLAIRVDPESGLLANDNQPGVVDYFYREFLPSAYAGGGEPSTGVGAEEVRNQLF